MRPTTATLRDPSSLEFLGAGYFASAYLQADGTVLKISRTTDGSMDFIEWCAKRLKKFGKGSAEMSGLPEVECCGRTDDGWWAVMPRYVCAKEHTKHLPDGVWTRNWSGYVFTAAIAEVVQLIKKVFKKDKDGHRRSYLDIHAGNVMWDPRREQWVVTDPLSDDATGTGAKAKQPIRFGPKPIAAWKRSPLQCLHHMARA